MLSCIRKITNPIMCIMISFYYKSFFTNMYTKRIEIVRKFFPFNRKPTL